MGVARSTKKYGITPRSSGGGGGRGAVGARGGQRGHEVAAGAGQAVQMAGRPAVDGRLPRCFQQPAVGQPHQDRVQRSGLEVHLGGQVVAVPPAGRVGGQRPQYVDRLRRMGGGYAA